MFERYILGTLIPWFAPRLRWWRSSTWLRPTHLSLSPTAWASSTPWMTRSQISSNLDISDRPPRCCRTTVYLVCATLPALPRSPQSLDATRSRASGSLLPNPGTSPPPHPRSFKRGQKRQNGQLLQACQKRFIKYLESIIRYGYFLSLKIIIL